MVYRDVKSFQYALQGLRIAFSEERNVKIQLVVGICAAAAGAYFHISQMEWLFVIAASGLVLTAELLNTSLEELCDMLEPSHNPHVAKIKDLAAGGVLLASIAAAAIGLCIFLPHLLSL